MVARKITIEESLQYLIDIAFEISYDEDRVVVVVRKRPSLFTVYRLRNCRRSRPKEKEKP